MDEEKLSPIASKEGVHPERLDARELLHEDAVFVRSS